MARLAGLRLRDRWEDWSKKVSITSPLPRLRMGETGGVKFGLSYNTGVVGTATPSVTT
jgi:hypothetical protein